MLDGIDVASDAEILAWRIAHLSQMTLEGRVEDTFYQTRLARTRDTSHYRHHIEWELNVDASQVVHPGTLDIDVQVPGAATLRHVDGLFA